MYTEELIPMICPINLEMFSSGDVDKYSKEFLYCRPNSSYIGSQQNVHHKFLFNTWGTTNIQLHMYV